MKVRNDSDTSATMASAALAKLSERGIGCRLTPTMRAVTSPWHLLGGAHQLRRSPRLPPAVLRLAGWGRKITVCIARE
jgi:hypothetical protein